jgi:hypothetical protein
VLAWVPRARESQHGSTRGSALAESPRSTVSAPRGWRTTSMTTAIWLPGQRLPRRSLRRPPRRRLPRRAPTIIALSARVAIEAGHDGLVHVVHGANIP